MNEAAMNSFINKYGEASSFEFVKATKKGWDETHSFVLPQPGLKKHNQKFGISDNRYAVKHIGARFDKRVLKIMKVYEDSPNPKPPSIPFGFYK